jgi:uncharacterized membrane protein
MASTNIAVGPVDVVAVLFEGNKFNGEVAPALLELEEKGIVTILDLALVVKDDKGDVAMVEVEDHDIAELLSAIVGDRVDLLSEDDLAGVAASLPNSSSALVIVFENSWASRFAKACADSGGTLVAYDRIPAEVLQKAFAALEGE